ncbi:MAG: prolipoprotein diacylglyceryl transferase [Rhodothermales bacterium]|nr:prolipoprotein diacylglyceryl transferase [Rhodothermales bacterium]
MYPRLSDLFQDLFGFSLPLPLYSFGLMVAVAILTATWLTKRELDRMYAGGRVGPIRLREEGRKGRTRWVETSPSALVWTFMLMAAFFGVLGAKFFHLLEYPEVFARDPIGAIFSSAGLTIYGGLIVAGLAIGIYANKKGLDWRALCDATAPGLMLAYGIGRIGCYLAGDGDWGECSDLAEKPAFLPDWLWSETFPRNILDRDLVAQCGVPYDGVYPTMLYEFAMAAALAGVLWALRKHPYLNGWLFSLYLVFNGVERFLIEQIRVNVPMFTVGSYEVTQAMFIAVLFVIAGLVGLVLTTKRREPETPRQAPEPVAAQA